MCDMPAYESVSDFCGPQAACMCAVLGVRRRASRLRRDNWQCWLLVAERGLRCVQSWRCRCAARCAPVLLVIVTHL
jgi:hypothetical protein